MSSLINKAKDKLDAMTNKDNKNTDNYGTHGTHTSTTGNTVDPTVGSGTTTGVHGHHAPAQTHHATTSGTGAYGSSGTNDPAYNNPQSTTAGPHSSNLLNKADPRVDSDRDNRNDPTSRVGGYGTQGEDYGHTTGTGYGNTAGGIGSTTGYAGQPGHTSHTTHTGHTGHTGTTGHTGGLAAAAGTTGGSGYGNTGAYDNPRSTNEGPHGSNLLNKADPRVDSDRDNRNDPTSRVGGYGTQGENYGHTAGNLGGHGGSGITGTTGNYSTGTTGGYETGTTGGYGSGTTGGYGSGTTGVHGHDTTTGGYGSGTTGGYGSGATGTHGHSNTTHGDSSYTPGSGNATQTAGPHNSDMLNKLDPRVDSDMDGSKTYGGNATHQ